MGKSTNKELVHELEARNTESKYDAIIERAKSNGYHDFKFDENKYVDTICPKIDLVNDLSAFPELSDIRTAVMEGEYDEEPDEEDHKMMEQIMKDFGKPSFN